MDDSPKCLIVREDGIPGQFWADATFGPRSVTDVAAGLVQFLASGAAVTGTCGYYAAGAFLVRRLDRAAGRIPSGAIDGDSD